MKKSFYAKLYAILAFLKGLPKFSRITVTTENGSLKNDQKYNGFSGDDTKNTLKSVKKCRLPLLKA